MSQTNDMALSSDFRRRCDYTVVSSRQSMQRPNTVPCDRPYFFSSSVIVAPASYSRFIARASVAETLRVFTSTFCSRSIRMSADGATPSSRASDRALSPVSDRRTTSSTLSSPRRFDNSCG